MHWIASVKWTHVHSALTAACGAENNSSTDAKAAFES